MSFTHYHQLDQMDCGPTCLRMVAKHYGKHFTAQTLREKAQISRDGVSMLGIAEAAQAIGFHSIGVKVTLDKLVEEAPLPCVLHWGQNHFVVLHAIGSRPSAIGRQMLARIWGGRRPGGRKQQIDMDPYLDTELQPDNNSPKTKYQGASEREGSDDLRPRHRQDIFHIADPAKGLITYTADEFEKKWLAGNKGNRKQGLALLLEPTPRFYVEEGEKVNGLRFGQLMEYLWQYKKLVVQLGLGTLVGSALSLLMPFLTQSVVDVGIGTQDLSFIHLILIAQMMLLLSTAAIGFSAQLDITPHQYAAQSNDPIRVSFQTDAVAGFVF
ncbi:hypothetical protein E0F88_03920 [Dyadobacter psychrotolerans]|uniref:Peptidase C39 domain-containing protein n=1 Tax=Dyadobacter psychrotolerans TaxID=2541721 RepID=A0A4R5DXZ7_9BACT|nr:cysteine peptidase family C39 domain-containing protein [Dyadobacter psychrotolerans]TDE17061.1 hypothetical protein E0F88_03920 [Dyadobacter psychrotolerans]